MANESLGKAKSRKNDEFYTVYDYIQKEMNAYLEYDPNVFRGKTILLPCDDPEWSNFTKYFAQNFETLGIKKLISTSYATDRKKQQYEQYHQMTLFELNFPQYDEEKPHSHGKIFTLTRDINKSGVIDIDDLEWQYLEGDGDFLCFIGSLFRCGSENQHVIIIGSAGRIFQLQTFVADVPYVAVAAVAVISLERKVDSVLFTVL